MLFRLSTPAWTPGGALSWGLLVGGGMGSQVAIVVAGGCEGWKPGGESSKTFRGAL